MEIITPLPPTVLIACGLLIAAIISMWCRPRWLWLAAAALAIGASYSVGVMFGPAVLWFALLAFSLVLYRRSFDQQSLDQRPLVWIRIVSLVTFVVIALLLGAHVLPGFNNPLLVENALLSDGAMPYTLYFNFDKSFVGIVIIGSATMLLSKPTLTLDIALRRALPIIILTVIGAMLLAHAFGEIHFDPRWTSFFWIWAAVNVLLTCMSEEAFFRAFVQREIRVAAGDRRGAAVIAVTVSALLFGLAHFAGGWRYVVVATLAGVGYALVYERTKRIELSIAAHFAVNATHFLLFTYPRVAAIASDG